MSTPQIPTVDPNNYRRYWLDDDEVTFDPSLVPPAAWLACVKEATQSYGSFSVMVHNADGQECTHMLGECPYVGPFPHGFSYDSPEVEAYWDRSNETHHWERKPVEDFSPEGVAYAGHRTFAEPNQWGDGIVIAYRYNAEKGWGAIVGLCPHPDEMDDPDTYTYFGWRVSCYAN